jgi:hypothetical protein
MNDKFERMWNEEIVACIQDSIPGFSWRDWGQTCETTVLIICASAEFPTGRLSEALPHKPACSVFEFKYILRNWWLLQEEIHIRCEHGLMVSETGSIASRQHSRRAGYGFIFTLPIPLITGSRDSVVGIATGYSLEDRGFGVRVPVASRIFSSPRRRERFWGPPSLLSIGYRGPSPRRYSGRVMKLTTHLQIVPRSRKCGSVHPPPYAFMT